ncbi:ANTAR domain-containing protein [Streptomyces sp. NPDC059893]|uniref:ANTAR domain-containing protein n=1 Tax=Streptomyces sp. NPDC059893 TaxID=3346990 RepID=UPI00364841CB
MTSNRVPGGNAQRLEALESKAVQLQRAVRSHTMVDQAIGVLVAVGRLSPAERWDVLREVSMHTNIKLRHVAELLIEWGQSGALCSDIRRELDRQLAQRGAEAGRPSTDTRLREGTSPDPDSEQTGAESEFAAEPSQEDHGPSHVPG